MTSATLFTWNIVFNQNVYTTFYPPFPALITLFRIKKYVLTQALAFLCIKYLKQFNTFDLKAQQTEQTENISKDFNRSTYYYTRSKEERKFKKKLFLIFESFFCLDTYRNVIEGVMIL